MLDTFLEEALKIIFESFGLLLKDIYSSIACEKKGRYWREDLDWFGYLVI